MIRVFLLAGQSNVFGADSVIEQATKARDLVQVGEQRVEDRTSLFTFQHPALSYAWGTVRGHDNYYLGETTYLGNVVKGHGPEVGFARTLGGGVAIIKYAANYTVLQNSKSAWVSPNSLWTSWQAFVDASLASIGQPYTVSGFGWLQGIDDGLLSRTQAAYEADLRQIISDLRAKFGNLPFVLGRSINSAIAGSTKMLPIRAGQEAVGAEANNRWYSTDDLTPYVNTHHLTAAHQLTSGRRMALRFRRYLSGSLAQTAEWKTALETASGLPRRAVVVGGADRLPQAYSAGAPGWTTTYGPSLFTATAGGLYALHVPDRLVQYLGQTVGPTTLPGAGALVFETALDAALQGQG